jgi:redox-sensitive bicupin YhaK (pirin superfamily)
MHHGTTIGMASANTTSHRSSASPNDSVVWRPAAERFHSQLDWLDSWHSFSFAGHHDPAWMGFGPLRVINDDTIAPGRGFGMHPHRDMEIITVMVEGQLNHRDSMGHAAVLRAGEVQRMSAGTGIVHSEVNAGSTPCRLLQIWIEPSRGGIGPAYGQKPFRIGGQWTPLIDPNGSDGAMAIERPVRLWRAQPQPGQHLPLQLTAGALGWLQVISGSAALRLPAAEPTPSPSRALPQVLSRGDGLGFGGPTQPLEAEPTPGLQAGADGADLLLFELA